MLNIEIKNSRRIKWFWVLFVLCSAMVHITAFILMNDWAEATPRTHYEGGTVEINYMEEIPLPDPEPVTEIESQKAPEPVAELPEKVVVKKRTFKSNRKQQSTPTDANSEDAKPVFGATAESVGNHQSNVSVRVGNTLAKEMEKTFVKPSKVKEITAPPTPAGAVEQVAKKAPEKKKRISPVPVYELSSAPSFSNKVEPQYPDEAKRKEIEGVVQLEVLIDENGKVRKVKVLKSPGYGLERAAIVALTKSRFKPGIMNGKAVPVRIKIPYRFVLSA